MTRIYSDALYSKYFIKNLFDFLFPGYNLHVASYLTSLEEDNLDRYAKQFSRFVTNGIEPSDILLLTLTRH